MSHTMKINAELKDRDAIMSACDRLNLRMEEGSFRLYGSEEKGLGIFLEGWRYPAVVKEDGTVMMDTYNGHWGDMQKFNELKAYYGTEKCKIEARRKGHTVYESYNETTNKIELRIGIGG